MPIKDLEAPMRDVNERVLLLIEEYGEEKVALSLVACGAFLMGKHIAPNGERPCYGDGIDATRGLLSLVYNFLPMGAGQHAPPPPGFEIV